MGTTNATTNRKPRRAHTLTCGICRQADGKPMAEVMHRDGTWHVEHIRGVGCRACEMGHTPSGQTRQEGIVSGATFTWDRCAKCGAQFVL